MSELKIKVAKYNIAKNQGRITMGSSTDIPSFFGKKGLKIKLVSVTDDRIHIVFDKSVGYAMRRRKAKNALPWHTQMSITQEVSENIEPFGPTEVKFERTTFGVIIHLPKPEDRNSLRQSRKTTFTRKVKSESNVPSGTYGPGSDIKQLRYISRVKKLIVQLNSIKDKSGIDLILSNDGNLKATVKVEI